MKVLSILQPWASLVVMDAKHIETRTRNIKYRGPLLIHASQSKEMGMKSQFHNGFLSQVYKYVPDMPAFVDLPFGQIIGMVDVIDSFPTELTWAGSGGIGFKSNLRLVDGDVLKMVQITHQEKAFGDYSPDRYGWMLSNPVQFKTGIPYRGNVGLQNYNGLLPE